MLESTKIYYFSGTGNSLSIAKDLTSDQFGNHYFRYAQCHELV
jgi:flavodoxin